jgi:hypothetical protein
MGEKSKTAIAFQALMILSNSVELLLLVMYFWGVVFNDNTYIYFNVAQYVLGVIFGFFVYVDYYDSPRKTIRDLCQLIPFAMHVSYHAIGHIIAVDAIVNYRTSVVMFMVGKSIASINVFITYLHQDY